VNTAEFKDSPLGRIPVDWDVVKLEDVIEIHDNKRIPLSETERINRKGDYPYCGANGVIDYIDDYIFDGEFLLLAEDGGDYSSLGRSAYLMNGKFWVNNHAHVIEAIHSKTTNKFLLYILTYLNLNHYTVGSTRKKLNQSIMRKIKLPLPPLEEQKMISEILQDVDSAIENVNKAIDTTEKLKRGLMQRLLMEGINHTEFKDSPAGKIPKDWKIVNFGEIFEFKRGFSYKGSQVTKDRTRKRFITINDIQKGGGIKDGNEKIYIKNRVDVKEDFHIKEGDLLIANTDMSKGYIIGAPILIKNTTENLIYSMDLTKLQPNNPKLDKNFFYYLLKEDRIRLKMKTFAQGTNVLHLNHSLVKNLKVPLPPLEEQKMISEILQDVDRRLELLRERKVKLENIKRGLMNDLLTGKRRVRITS